MTNIIKLLKNTTIAAITALSITGCNNPPGEANFKNLNPKTQTFVTENMRKGVYPEAEITGHKILTFYILKFQDGSFFEDERGTRIDFLSKEDAENAMKMINNDILSQNISSNILIKEIISMNGLKLVELNRDGEIISIK